MNTTHKRFSLIAAAALATTLGVGVAGAQQSQNNQDDQQQVAGQAVVRELDGPEFDVQSDQGAQMVVLFPQAQQQQGRQSAGSDLKGLEIVLIEMEVPTKQDGQDKGQSQSQQQNTEPHQTGRQIVFTADKAVNGLAAYQLEQGKSNRRYKVIARLDGREVDVKESRGSDGMTILTVSAKPSDEQKQKYDDSLAKYQDKQKQQQQAKKDQKSDKKDGAEAQKAGGNVGDRNAQADQRPQEPGDTDAAVLIIYTGTEKTGK